MPIKSPLAKKYTPWVSLLLGGLIFFAIYGFKIINPHFLTWPVNTKIDHTTDALQHFIGWHVYRFDSWRLPLGNTQNYAYPQITSIVYTDSIPLLAVFFKLLSPLLPPIFQYFGLWLLLCYLLQGYFGALLVGKITDKPILIILGSLLFILSPVMLRRAIVHSSLVAHFVILWSIYLYLSQNQLKNCLQWLVLLVLSLMIHFYLFAMAFIIFIAYLGKLRFCIEKRKNSQSIAIFLTMTVIISLLTMWLMGYFTLSQLTNYGFNHFSMNLIAPIDPQNFASLFLKSLSTRATFEGFNYLGLGVILLILLAIFSYSKAKPATIKMLTPIIIAALGFFLFSLSNKIFLFNSIHIDYPLPTAIYYVCTILRASGRLFWPVSYLLLLASLAILMQNHPSKKITVWLIFIIIIQILDFAPAYKLERQYITHATWQSPLKSESWPKLIHQVKHIALIPPVFFQDIGQILPFVELIKKNTSINTKDLARPTPQMAVEYKHAVMTAFSKQPLDPNTLYVLRKNAVLPNHLPADFVFATLDHMNIIISKQLANHMPDLKIMNLGNVLLTGKYKIR